MNHLLHDPQEILHQGVSGFHQYKLSKSPRLCYVSENLCRMTGYDQRELLDAKADRYEQLIHPGDREEYKGFLHALRSNAQNRSLRYRLIKKDGTVLYVSDTAVSRELEDGTWVADCVLTDITELKNENKNLRFLSETMPCGFLKYTCEKLPKVTYINEQMLKMLRFPQEPELRQDCLELYSQNLFLMIPQEDRRRFGVYLNNVYQNGGPIAGEMTALRYDGTRIRLFGWVTKCVNEDGAEEFQSACMDVTQRYTHKVEQEQERYVQALTAVYDKIFAYDLSERTVKCLHSNGSPVFRYMENIPMQMAEATEKWIMENAAETDQEKLRAFFSLFCQLNTPEPEIPPVIRYRAKSCDGILRYYSGLFLTFSDSVRLFCCRREQDVEEADRVRDENRTLRGINENMQRLVMHFTDGLAAFEIVDDTVTPLYASENVYRFFGFSQDEWMETMQKRTSIPEFVSRCKVAYADFAELLATGEAEFTYFDFSGNRERRIKAICSQKEPGQHGRRYVMLYNLEEKHQKTAEPARVFIRTFGYFDVFVDGRPIAFRNEKSKELFALLTDRRGGFVSSEEAIAYLWEDEPANSVTLARYRKVALRLKNLLEEYGIPDIMESVNGKRRLVTEKVQCDLYDYLSGQEELFKGSYMTNYSWSEPTLAELARRGLQQI